MAAADQKDPLPPQPPLPHPAPRALDAKEGLCQICQVDDIKAEFKLEAPNPRNGVRWPAACACLFHAACLLQLHEARVDALDRRHLCPSCGAAALRGEAQNLFRGLVAVLRGDAPAAPDPNVEGALAPEGPPPDGPANAGEVKDDRPGEGERVAHHLRWMRPLTTAQQAEAKKAGIFDQMRPVNPADRNRSPHTHPLTAADRGIQEVEVLGLPGFRDPMPEHKGARLVAFNGDAMRFARFRNVRVQYDTSAHGRAQYTKARANDRTRRNVCACATGEGAFVACRHVERADFLWFYCSAPMNTTALARLMHEMGAHTAFFMGFNINQAVGARYAEMSWHPYNREDRDRVGHTFTTFIVKVNGDADFVYRMPFYAAADGPVSVDMKMHDFQSLDVALVEGGGAANAFFVRRLSKSAAPADPVNLRAPLLEHWHATAFGAVDTTALVQFPANAWMAAVGGDLFGSLQPGRVFAVPRELVSHVRAAVVGRAFDEKGLITISTELSAYVNSRVNAGELKVAGWGTFAADIAPVMPYLVRLAARDHAQAHAEARAAIPATPEMANFNAARAGTYWDLINEHLLRYVAFAGSGPLALIASSIGAFLVAMTLYIVLFRFQLHIHGSAAWYETIWPVIDVRWYWYFLAGNPRPIIHAVGSMPELFPIIIIWLVAFLLKEKWPQHRQAIARYAGAFSLAIVTGVAMRAYDDWMNPPPPPPTYAEKAAAAIMSGADAIAGAAKAAASGVADGSGYAYSKGRDVLGWLGGAVVARYVAAAPHAAEAVEAAWRAARAAAVGSWWSYELIVVVTALAFVWLREGRRPVRVQEIGINGVDGVFLGPTAAYGRPRDGVAYQTADAEYIGPEPELDPNARISANPSYLRRKWKPKVQFRGPVCSAVHFAGVPATFKSSQGNEVAALKCRTGKARRPVNPIAVGRFLAMSQAWMFAIFSVATVKAMPIPEYVRRFPVAVARRLMDALRAWGNGITMRLALRTGAINKRELAKPVYGLRTGKSRPRIVVPCQPARNICVGPAVVAAKDYCFGTDLGIDEHGNDCSFLVPGPGRTAEQLGRSITRAVNRPHVIFESDARAFESCRPRWSFYPLYWLLHMYGLATMVTPSGVGLVKFLKKCWRMYGRTPNGVKYRIDDCLTSGDATTTLSNTLFMMFAWMYVLAMSNGWTIAELGSKVIIYGAGDDTLVVAPPGTLMDNQHFIDIGLDMEHAHRERIEDATFCSNRFYWAVVDGERILMPAPKIFRILSRFGWFVDLGARPGSSRADGILRGAAIGLLCCTRAVPELQALARAIIRATAGRRPLHHHIRARDWRPTFRSTSKSVVADLSAPRYVPLQKMLIDALESVRFVPVWLCPLLVVPYWHIDGVELDRLATDYLSVVGCVFVVSSSAWFITIWNVTYTLFIAHRFEEWVYKKCKPAFYAMCVLELVRKVVVNAADFAPASRPMVIGSAVLVFLLHLTRNGNHAERVRNHKVSNYAGFFGTMFGLPGVYFVYRQMWHGRRRDKVSLAVGAVAGLLACGAVYQTIMLTGELAAQPGGAAIQTLHHQVSRAIEPYGNTTLNYH